MYKFSHNCILNDNFFQIVTLLQYYGKIAEGRGACRGNELK